MAQIFIIDDSVSMKEHWSDLTALFRDLTFMIKKKKLDPNGCELRFITSGEKMERTKTTQLVDAVAKRRYANGLKGTADFARRLDSVLGEYLTKLRKNSSTTPISIYVLTNGIWEQNFGDISNKDHHLDQVSDVITTAINTLNSLSAIGKKVGIQFVRFGNNEIGKERLRYLDARMHKDRGLSRDICDTTIANGNVWKMMLGAIDPAWDDDPDDDGDAVG